MLKVEIEEELKAIGRRAASIRYRRDIRQYKAAELLGLDKTSLCLMERGRVAITLKNLLKMRKLYGCKMADFFQDEEEKPKLSDLELIAAVVKVFANKNRR